MYFIISAGVIRGIEFREGVLGVEVKNFLAGSSEGSLRLYNNTLTKQEY